MAIKRLYGESDDTYNKRNSMTGYTYEHSAAKDALRDQIMNRPKFQYDLGTDMNYQQAKEQYQALGKIAMNDTIGKASSLTGGYANSYATSAGQQAYNSHLKELNASIPQYYAMALDAYQREGDELLNKYGIYDSEEQTGYNRYMDAYSNLQTLAQMENSDAVSQRDYDESVRQYNETTAYQKERDAEADRQWQAQMDYQKARDAVSDSQWEKNYNLSLASTVDQNADADEPVTVTNSDATDQFVANVFTSREFSKRKGTNGALSVTVDGKCKRFDSYSQYMDYMIERAYKNGELSEGEAAYLVAKYVTD